MNHLPGTATAAPKHTDRHSEKPATGLDQAFAAFVAANPAWAATAVLDQLRETEYSRLDRNGQVYLDYTGGGLYADCQIRAHSEMLTEGVFGNPHSHNPTSQAMSALVDASRAAVLEFFNAPADEWTVVFTPNASGALKLVGESFPFSPEAGFVLAGDNHNSVNGIREYARAKNAPVRYVDLSWPELRLDEQQLNEALTTTAPGLFAFPAQSNFSGVKHPLRFGAQARRAGWKVLLDAAAFAPTSRLSVADIECDFVALSFYKMFGFPTGIGALLARRSVLEELDRPWFAGGTIRLASVAADRHCFAADEAAFEDGTINYLMIPPVATGLDFLNQIGMETIGARVQCLTRWLLDTIAGLNHTNGTNLVHVLGPRDDTDRGGTVTMTLLDPDGVPYSGARIEELAAERNISVRTGCFCNPGAGETAHQLGETRLRSWLDAPATRTFGELAERVRADSGIEISAVRASFGLASTFGDAFALVEFLETLIDLPAQTVGFGTLDEIDRDGA